jgi:hypothetical protein
MQYIGTLMRQLGVDELGRVRAAFALRREIIPRP